MLQEIYANRIKQVEEAKSLYPAALLEKSVHFNAPTVSLSHYLKRPDKSGIIAEFKRKSPSKGVINAYAAVKETTINYMQAGASALSVLTESSYFDGKNEDLAAARQANYCPILRKDFIVDEYQVLEARSIGSDAILLIADMLDKAQIEAFYSLARALNMEVLIEIHEAVELDKLPSGEFILGVNNRNLKTMEVDIQTSLDIIEELPPSQLCISESGISSASQIVTLKEAGYQGFLIGEQFMRAPHPGQALESLIKELQTAL